MILALGAGPISLFHRDATASLISATSISLPFLGWRNFDRLPD
jgi:hypothetical protein